MRATLEGGALHSFSGTSSHVTDRFFLSSRQVRGFNSRGIGPRDLSDNTSNDVLGGNRYVAARLEAEFPLGLPSEYGLTGSIFADAGSLWSLDDRMGGRCFGSGGTPIANCVLVDDSFDLRSAVGFGLLWDTPIGPVAHGLQQASGKERAG